MLNANSKVNAFSNKQRDMLACLLLVLLTLAVYWPVKNYDFVNFDDDTYVTENKFVRAGLTQESITWAFATTYAGNWHPLTWLSHMLDCDLFGLNPGRHHLVNLFFHIINVLLLFILFKKMTDTFWQSSALAALFALHPLHVESVAWIAERKDVLSALFWMLTMLSYIRYVERPGIDRYLPVLALLTLGLMAKPMLVTLPFVLLLLDYWPLHRLQFEPQPGAGRSGHQPIIRRLFIEKIPLVILAAISSVITVIVQKPGGNLRPLDIIPLDARIANALVAYVNYIKKAVWPSNLAVLYPHPGGTLPWFEVAGALFLLLFISFTVVGNIRCRPYLAMGWFWFLGTLVPVIGLVQVGRQAMADRYTYIPLIGLFIMVCWGLSELFQRRDRVKIVFIAGTTALLIVLSAGTFLQVQHWKNSITLFEHTLAVTSGNFLPHNNLGVALEKLGRIDEAIEHYLAALRINPEFEKTHNNIGIALDKQGKADEAIRHFREALRLNSDFEKAHNNLGIALFRQGDITGAVHHFQEAVRIKPDYVKAQNNLHKVLRIYHQNQQHFITDPPLSW